MSNNKRIVILCEAYRSLDYLLYRLENEKVDVPVTVFITALEDLYKLCQVLNEKVFNNRLELIYYETYESRWNKIKGIKKWLYLLPDILGERRRLKKFYDRYFAKLEGATVIFSSPAFTGVKIYVIRRLSKRNRLVFRDAGPPYMVRYSPRSLREIATLIMYKFMYGKDTQLGQYPAVDPLSKGFPLIPDSFMKNSVDSVIDWSKRAEIMKDFTWDKYRVFNTGDIKVIYFHQDLVGRYVPDRDTFKRELDDIFKVLLRHFPEKEIAYKFHPGHELNKNIIEIGEELPIYVPAQLLYGEKVQIYLGIFSSAITNVSRAQAISLIELITFNEDKIRERFKERLITTSRMEIFFPTSLDEFEEIITNVKKQKS